MRILKIFSGITKSKPALKCPLPHSTTSKSEAGNTTKYVKQGALSVVGVFLASHIVCILVATGIVSSSGVAAWNFFCTHSNHVEPKNNFSLERLENIPKDFKDIPESLLVERLLKEKQPGIEEIVQAKQKEKPEAKIKLAFIETNQGDACVVVCENGSLCPCKNPYVYKIGSMSDDQSEAFQGQKEIISALNNLKAK